MATPNPYANIPMMQMQQPGFSNAYNPIAAMFGQYYGQNVGGGVPPASSGFRYRNKKAQLTGDATGIPAATEATKNNAIVAGSYENWDPTDPGYADAQKIASDLKTPVSPVPNLDAQKELQTLNADRKSYIANGLVSGLPGVISSIAALHDNAQGLKRLNGLNPESYIPQEVRDVAGAATLASKSAVTADNAQRKADINANANAVVGNAQLTASTPEQLQQIALLTQKNSNNAINELGREGTTTQTGRKRYADTLNMNLGNMRQGVKNLIEQQKATLREAQSRNRTQLLENLGMTALTMGV